MDIQLSKPQKVAMEFANGEFDKDALFPQTIWEKAVDIGLIGTHLPEEFGGGGMGHLENVLVAEAFAISDSTIGSAVMLAGVAVGCLIRFGSKEQKKTLLHEILRLSVGRRNLETHLLPSQVDDSSTKTICTYYDLNG